ncbi:MAG: hypothetical protein K9N62_01845 [Verrucomicrobia bacterium]|nr:hypothetical protein [Verrucomicrobiota bacterium]
MKRTLFPVALLVAGFLGGVIVDRLVHKDDDPSDASPLNFVFTLNRMGDEPN